jgi:hypothetical protein
MVLRSVYELYSDKEITNVLRITCIAGCGTKKHVQNFGVVFKIN